MASLLGRVFGWTPRPSPWKDRSAIREMLFSVERLQERARSLAIIPSSGTTSLLSPTPYARGRPVRELSACLRDGMGIFVSKCRNRAAPD